MHKNFLVADILGFNSMYDFLGTIFVFKEKTLIPIFSFILTISFAGIEMFVDKVIYSPSIAIGILFGVSILDTILGASAAVKLGYGLSSNKIGRAFVRFAVQVVCVAFLYQLSVIYSFIPKQAVDVFLLIFTISTFWSAISNAYRLGLVTEDQYLALQQVITLKAFLERFIKKQKK